MSGVRDAKSSVSQDPRKSFDGINRLTRFPKDRLPGRVVLADLNILSTNLVELAAYFINQVEPLRRKQDGPLGAFAVKLQ